MTRIREHHLQKTTRNCWLCGLTLSEVIFKYDWPFRLEADDIHIVSQEYSRLGYEFERRMPVGLSQKEE